MRLARRGFLAGATGLGLSVTFTGCAAETVRAPAPPGRPRLVVVVCRGAMDGLSVTPPRGDSAYAGLRGALRVEGPRFDGDFDLHPAMPFIHRSAERGELRIAPAIATGNRRRSHFEAQDVLETGGDDTSLESGWLNRTLAALGGEAGRALSVGPAAPLILRGSQQATSWTPGRRLASQGETITILQELYRRDPLMGSAFAAALQTDALAMEADRRLAGGGAPSAGAPDRARGAARSLGGSVAGLMRQDGGPDIVALEADGFDTHARQGAASGQLATRLSYVDAMLEGLAEGLGRAWGATLVLCVTEFGRTVRPNGTAGTDHGTASTALVVGGAVRSRGLIGDWPGLAEGRLLDGRDLRPTLDVRSLFKGALRDHLGLDAAAVDGVVFPDSGGAAAVPSVLG